MNWEAAGAIGEIVGAIAVVATLGYLAMQIKQSNLSSRVAAKQEMTRQLADYTDLLIMNPEVHRVYRRGLAGDPLEEEQEDLFRTLMLKANWYYSSMHFQYLCKTVSEGEWSQSRAVIKRVVTMPGYERFWRVRKEDYSPDYVAFVEQLRSEKDV